MEASACFNKQHQGDKRLVASTASWGAWLQDDWWTTERKAAASMLGTLLGTNCCFQLFLFSYGTSPKSREVDVLPQQAVVARDLWAPPPGSSTGSSRERQKQPWWTRGCGRWPCFSLDLAEGPGAGSFLTCWAPGFSFQKSSPGLQVYNPLMV